MRKVMYKEYVQNADKKWELKEMGTALFHQFGCDIDDNRETLASYSTAIIELPDGTVKNIRADMIRFLD